MKKVVFSLLLLGFSAFVQANSPFGPVKVIAVTVHDSNMLIVTIADDGERKHTEQCDSGRERSLVINKSSPYEKEMFAIALAAQASGKLVKGWANGCHSFWSYKAPKLTLLSIVE